MLTNNHDVSSTCTPSPSPVPPNSTISSLPSDSIGNRRMTGIKTHWRRLTCVKDSVVNLNQLLLSKVARTGVPSLDLGTMTTLPEIKNDQEPATKSKILLEKYDTAPTDLLVTKNKYLIGKYLARQTGSVTEILCKLDPPATKDDLVILTYDQIYSRMKDIDSSDTELLKCYDDFGIQSSPCLYDELLPHPIGTIFKECNFDISLTIRQLYNQYLGWETAKYKWLMPQFRVQIDIMRKSKGVCTVVSPTNGSFVRRNMFKHSDAIHRQNGTKHSDVAHRRGSSKLSISTLNSERSTSISINITPKPSVLLEWMNTQLKFTKDGRDIISAKTLYDSFCTWNQKISVYGHVIMSAFVQAITDLPDIVMSNDQKFVIGVTIKND
jgi:hypothetical protein